MNLAPAWVGFFAAENVEALHWSDVGDARAKDTEIMAWARQHGCVVFTNDLDFTALLAHTSASGPSVMQVRTQDVMPDALGRRVVRLLVDHAIVTLDELNARVRVLPIRSRP